MGAGEVQGVCEFTAELGRCLVSFFFFFLALRCSFFAEDSCVVVIIIFTNYYYHPNIRLLASFVTNPGGCFCVCFTCCFLFAFLCFAFFSFLSFSFFVCWRCAPALRKTGGMGIEMAMRCDVPASGREAKNVRWIHRGRGGGFVCSSVRSRRTHSSSLRMVIADFCSFLYSALPHTYMRLSGTLQRPLRPLHSDCGHVEYSTGRDRHVTKKQFAALGVQLSTTTRRCRTV